MKTEIKEEKDKFLKEYQLLELQRNKLKTCKRNLQDQELLDKGRFVNLLVFLSILYSILYFLYHINFIIFLNYRRKFLLYKVLTGIRWDYEKLKETITGCILFNIKFIV